MTAAPSKLFHYHESYNGHLLFPRYFIRKLHIFCITINGNIASISLYYLSTNLDSAAWIMPSEVERQWTKIIIIINIAFEYRKDGFRGKMARTGFHSKWIISPCIAVLNVLCSPVPSPLMRETHWPSSFRSSTCLSTSHPQLKWLKINRFYIFFGMRTPHTSVYPVLSTQLPIHCQFCQLF